MMQISRDDRTRARERKGGCRWPVSAGVESPPTSGHTGIEMMRGESSGSGTETGLRRDNAMMPKG